MITCIKNLTGKLKVGSVFEYEGYRLRVVTKDNGEHGVWDSALMCVEEPLNIQSVGFKVMYRSGKHRKSSAVGNISGPNVFFDENGADITFPDILKVLSEIESALKEQPRNAGEAWKTSQSKSRASAKRKLRKLIKHLETWKRA
jgi:hypothetical protein